MTIYKAGSRPFGRSLARIVAVAGFVCFAASASAQADGSSGQPWSWAADGNAFYGYNYQQRHFTDFSAWESQNWVMGSGERIFGHGRLILHGMLSLEPFTLQAEGSPQLFQTGESYQRTPLINFQHPHDLFMDLGGTYRFVRPRTTYIFSAGLVGAPALGPTTFMHRESARDNPQAPLTHHSMDSSHISWGVVTFGIQKSAFTVEASGFRGEEPDENRTNIDTPRIDSYSARITWRHGPWASQLSAGHLQQPEWFEPYNEVRITGSVEFNGQVHSRDLAATFAWGENRDAVVGNGTTDSFLTEWDLKAMRSASIYGRAEIAEKQILGLGYHPFGFAEPHIYSHVDALTMGVIRDVIKGAGVRVGLGVDATVYHMSADLLPYYGGSHSYHFFVRWRPDTTTMAHMH